MGSRPRRPGCLSLSSSAAADDAAIDRLIEVEGDAAPSFASRAKTRTEPTHVVFASEHPAREPALEAIARLFALPEPG